MGFINKSSNEQAFSVANRFVSDEFIDAIAEGVSAGIKL